jgi:hypothetical protein
MLAVAAALRHGRDCSGDAPGDAGSTAASGTQSGGRDGPRSRPNHGFGGMRSGEGQHPPLPRHRPRRAPDFTGGCAGIAASIELTGSRFNLGPFHRGTSAQTPGTEFRHTMIAVRPTLTNSAAAPIYRGGMTGFRHVRPDDLPILERMGQPLPTRVFRRPPPRVPRGSVSQFWAAYRSSGLDDQAHADRCHTRGRNPRGGAGW